MDSYTRTALQTALVSGAAVISGVIKNKYVAVLLGSSGIGLAGLVNNAALFTAAIIGFGFPASEVAFVTRNVQAARLDEILKARKVYHLALLALGAFSTMACFVFWPQIRSAALIVQYDPRTLCVVLITAFFYTAASVDSAVITGTRNFSCAAKANISGILVGLAVTCWLSKEYGVSGMLFAVALASAATAGINAFCVKALHLPVSSVDIFFAKNLFRSRARSAGAFLLASLIPLASQFIIRHMVAADSGLSAAGNYQAAWAISSIYSGFLIAALNSDFYTRLTVHSTDRAEITRLVNSQIALLLPVVTSLGIILMLFGEHLVPLLYSHGFESVPNLLKFHLLGDVFRVSGVVLSVCLFVLGRKKVQLAYQFLVHTGYLCAAYYVHGMNNPSALGFVFSAGNALGFALLAWYLWKQLGIPLYRANLAKMLICFIGALTALALTYTDNVWRIGFAVTASTPFIFHYLRTILRPSAAPQYTESAGN